MAKKAVMMQRSGTMAAGEHETELRVAVLEIVQKVLKDASDGGGGRNRLFPNGVGLVEVQATLDLPKFTLSARIADVQYPPSGPKPAGLFEAVGPKILAVADDILTYCISLDNNNDPVMKDCNAFVKKVGKQFGVPIPDTNADGIVDAMNAAPFSKTTMDPAEAMGWAANGLVVAGMKLSELNPKYGTKYTNGHVAIVHATEDSAHPGFPMASWGRLGGRGQSNASIRLSFPAKACDDHAVHFAYAETS
jgi:hypothetical protein